jgi:uncharacterized SAM-binding protein YcdF (DUF218 family)
MKRKARWIWGAICISAIVVVTLVVSLREAILLEAGKFMAPEAVQLKDVADVAILEGTEFIGRGEVSTGMQLLSSGKAKRLVIVLHRIAPNHRPFAIKEDYSSSVRRALQRLGLKDSSFTIIETPIRNPITLTSAKGALQHLSGDGVKSAILVSPGFHLRRSYLVYQHLSVPLNITIYPVACFDRYQVNNWWRDGNGTRDFFEEVQKLVFYLLNGYIPLKFSYSTKSGPGPLSLPR